MQTLHNLNEGQFMLLVVIINGLLLCRSMTELIVECLPDELDGFEEAWSRNNKGDFSGWKDGFNMHGNACEIDSVFSFSKMFDVCLSF